MTKDEALKLALEALEKYARDFGSNDLTVKAMYVVRQALAQPEQLREENERLHVENRRLIDRIETIGVPIGVGGFATTTTSQPDWIERERAVGYREGHRAALVQRTWVGLTEKDICEAAVKSQEGISPRDDTLRFAIAIEAKLKEKNT